MTGGSCCEKYWRWERIRGWTVVISVIGWYDKKVTDWLRDRDRLQLLCVHFVVSYSSLSRQWVIEWYGDWHILLFIGNGWYNNKVTDWVRKRLQLLCVHCVVSNILLFKGNGWYNNKVTDWVTDSEAERDFSYCVCNVSWHIFFSL